MTDYHLVIDGATAEESWTYLDDDAALSDAPSIISLTRLKESRRTGRAQRAAWRYFTCRRAGQNRSRRRCARTGALYRPAGLIAIHFPAYRNGRGYSAARVLREEFNFTGQLRATGDVLYDQWAMMNAAVSTHLNWRRISTSPRSKPRLVNYRGLPTGC